MQAYSTTQGTGELRLQLLMALPSTPTDDCLSAPTSAYAGTSCGISSWPTSHDRHQTYFQSGQRGYRCPLSRRIRHCASIIRNAGRIARRRWRAPSTYRVNHCSEAWEATNPRHHSLHILQHICRKSSTFCTSSPTSSGFQIRPWCIAPRHQNNGKTCLAMFRFSRRAKGSCWSAIFISISLFLMFWNFMKIYIAILTENTVKYANWGTVNTERPCELKKAQQSSQQFSNWGIIKHGVPQGSILGPLLFFT
jgi:hypothetical protein